MEKTLKEPLLPTDSSLDAEIEETKKATYLDISFFSWLLFGWIPRYIKLGLRKPFQQNMHSKLRDTETSYGNFARLLQYWEVNQKRKYALVYSLLKTVKEPLIRGFIFMVASRLVALMGPYIMRELITYIQSDSFEYERGLILVGLIGLTKISMSLCSTQGAFAFRMAGTRAYNAVNALTYHKSLRFSLMRSTEQSLGKMMNYMQVDAYKLLPVSEQLASSLSAPFQIIAGVIMMYSFIGISATAGVLVLICQGYLNFRLSKRMIGFQKQVMQRRDERMKLTNEIINGIKFIKMSGWEEYFLEKGQNKRLEELGILRKQYTNQLMQIFSGWSIPMVITVSVFGTYIALGNVLTAQVAFPVVSVFFLLQTPLRMLPNQVNQCIETFVAMGRIQKFLNEEEITTKYITRNDLWCQDSAIKVENGNFYWIEPEKLKDLKKNKKKSPKDKKQVANNQGGTFALEMGPLPNEQRGSIASRASSQESSIIEEGKPLYILKNINLEIKKGAFVAIIGDVGSGKSSLLYSLLGEMKFHDYNMPHVSINGSIAYVPQKPWIINETLKENVLFESPYDEQRYKDALRYSSLESDIKILPHGDQTEIGEKGVNLSGGQKARVALAQAIYADKDIYLLDDPLSAVDVHVGTFIIQDCLSGYLKDKTRVLITHNLDYLKYVDYVYIMRRGRIVGQGTYREIKTHSYYKRLENISQRTGSVHSTEEEASPTTKKQKESIKAQKEAPKTVELDKKKKSSQKKPEGFDDDPNLKKLILEEDRQTGKLQTDVYKAFYRFYGGMRFFLMLSFSLITWTILSLSSNIYLSHWTSGEHTGDNSYEWHSLRIYGALALSCAFFNVARAATIFFKSVECSEHIHADMLKSVIRASINLFFDRVPIGRVLNRFSKDLNIVDTMVAFSTMRFSVFSFMTIADVFICVYGGSYFILPLVGIFFYFCVRAQKSYQTLNREVYRLESVSRSPVLSHFSETVNGLVVIRAYGSEERFFKDQTRQQDENIKNHVVLCGLANWFSLNTSLLSLVLIIPSIALCVCMKDYMGTSGGVVGLLISYCLTLDEDIRQTLAAHVELQSHLISIESVKPEASEVTLNPKNIPNYTPGNWPTDGSVDFVNYSVRYRPALPLVLTNLSLSIRAREKIGIVGRTGSGKSTLILSLLRILEPATGSILVDGVDISNIGLYELRNKITVIPQDPMLFSGTLRQNIDIAKEFTNEQIWEVMESVSLHEKIESKEGGLDMVITEDGRNLSAGEKQLICIARAILKKNKVILIDEATSNIDIETESFIQNTIKEKLKDSTVLTIAHRLKTIIESDKILVLGEGKVVEFDTPQNLLDNTNSFFYGLWEKAKRENAIID